MIMMKKYKFIAIDIETRNLTEQQIEIASQFVKPHPSTKDEAKKEAQVATKKMALVKKGALNDMSEIACIGFWTFTEPSPIVLHTFNFDKEIEGVAHAQYESEKKMLEAFSEMMNDACDEKTEIVVANSGFDLPKLRYASAIRNKVQMPHMIKPGAPNPVFDILRVAGKYFFVGNGAERSLSLDELARHCNIIQGKICSGAEIPGMIEAGDFENVINYNAIDVIATALIYKMLSNNQ